MRRLATATLKVIAIAPSIANPDRRRHLMAHKEREPVSSMHRAITVMAFVAAAVGDHAVAQASPPSCSTNQRPPSVVYGACLGGGPPNSGDEIWYPSQDAMEAAARRTDFVANAARLAFPLLVPDIRTWPATPPDKPTRHFPALSDYRPEGSYQAASLTRPIEWSPTRHFRLRLKGWPRVGFPCVGAEELHGGCSTLDAEIERLRASRRTFGWCPDGGYTIQGAPPGNATSVAPARFPLGSDLTARLGLRRDYTQPNAGTPTYAVTVRWRACPEAPKADAVDADIAKSIPRDGERIPIDFTETGICPAGFAPAGGGGDCSATIKLFPWFPSLTQTDSEFCEGNPCYPGTGNKTTTQHDFTFGGLRFERYYNTLRQVRTYAAIDQNWSHSFVPRIITAYLAPPHFGSTNPGPTSAFVFVQTERATIEPFRRVSDGVFRSDNRLGRILRYDAGQPAGTPPVPAGWVMVDDDGVQTRFDANGLPLQRVVPADPTRSLAFTHDGNDRLLTVADGAGRGLRFFYGAGSDGRLVAVQRGLDVAPDATRELVRFGYDGQGRLATVTQADGQTWTYGYNEAGRVPASVDLPYHLTSIRAPGANAWATYRYDDHGRVIDSYHGTAQAGRVQLQYDGDYQTTVTMPNGASKVYDFGTQAYRAPNNIGESDGIVSRVFNFEDPTCRTQNGNDDRLCKRIDKRGFETRYGYDATHLTSTREAVGTPQAREIRQTWDATVNRVTERRVCAPDCSQTANVEAITRWAYDAAGRNTARCEVDPANATALAYTCGSAANAPARVRQTRMIFCAAGDVPGTCGLVGQLRTIDGPRTDVVDHTQYLYRGADAPGCSTGGACTWRRGDLWKVTNAAAHVTEHLAYDDAGRLLSAKDPNGTITDFTYHARGWLETRTVRANADGSASADDARTVMGYDARGNLVRIEEPDGSFLRYKYDDADRLTEVRDAEAEGTGNRITYTLDAAGNRTREETRDTTGSVTRRLARQFNALGQMRSVIHAPYAAQTDLDHPSVKKSTFTYDENGSADRSTDPRGVVTDNDHDPLGRLARTISDLGTLTTDINATVAYTYDARDNLRTVVDPKGLTTSYTHDGLNDLTQLQSPDTGVTTYGYDAAGNRTSQTDARGVAVTHSYDALDRLTALSYPDATLNVVFAYDQSNATTGCSASWPFGRLTRMTDASGSTTYCYDRRGNVTRKVQVTTGTNLAVDMTYDRADRLETLTYPNGGRVRYGRDGQGRVQAVWWRAAGLTTETVVVSSVTYWALGPVHVVTFANGRTLTKAYDENYWIDAVTGGHTGLMLDFEPDDTGNIVELTVGTAANNRVYGYDDLNRLTSVVDGTAANVEAFAYDGTGNRLSKRAGAGTAVPYTYPSTSHRLQSVAGVPRTYDAAGNTLTSTGNGFPRFVYDARNRLSNVVGNVCESLNPFYCEPPPACDPETQVCQPIEVYLVEGTAAVYAHNGRGERVRKTAGSSTALFAYDGAGRLLGEYDAGGLARQLFVWMDDMPVAVVEGTTLRFVESDHLNTPRALIDPARNVAVWRWDLQGSAFGEHAANEDPDGDGIPVAFNLRFPGQYLDAETGLHYNYFRDYEPAAGRYIESDPIGLRGGLSTFSYVDSGPLEYTDPTGLQPIPLVLPRPIPAPLLPRPIPAPLDPVMPTPYPARPDLPRTGDCKSSEWAICDSRCAPYRALGCYVTIKWKIRGVRGGHPIRSEERQIECNCPEDIACR